MSNKISLDGEKDCNFLLPLSTQEINGNLFSEGTGSRQNI
jgi:hypothetical protein